MTVLNKLLLALFVFAVFGLATATPTYADSVQLTSAAQLNGGDLTFIYPETTNNGAPTHVANPYIRAAGGGNTITFNSPGAQGNMFTRFDRNDGTRMLLNGVSPIASTSTFVDISFANGVSEIGLNARPNSSGGTFSFEAFNGANSLGVFSVVAGPGSFFAVAGPFIGVRATAGDVITRLRITLNDGGSNVGFETDPVTFGNNAPVAVPEPATMLLLGTGLAGIAAKMRRRRKAQA